MNWVHPHWLWWLFSIPVLYFAFLRAHLERERRFERFANRKLWSLISPEADLAARLRKGRVWLVAFALILVALARPQWGAHEESVKVTGLDIVLLLDVSNSMEVEDVVPNRLKKAKHAIRAFLEQIRGDRVGVVAFAASSYVACPLTNDLDYVRETVEGLTPKSILNQGTDIGSALETANRALDRGAEEVTEKDRPNAGSRVILLISDGEDHEDSAIAVAKRLKSDGIRLYVLGVGTEKGGPIPARDEGGGLHGFKRGRGGDTVISSFSPQALTEIAQAAGGQYWSLTDSESELNALLGDLGALARGEYAERKYVVYQERFQWPLGLAILLLIIELGIPARKILTSLLLAFVLGSSVAEAAPLDVYLENKKGLDSYQDGQLAEAKRRFGNAQAKDPDAPELGINQGVIEYKEGDFESAAQGFENAAKRAIEQHDHKNAARSLLALGATRGKKQDETGAIQSYLSALDEAKAAKDDKLEQDIRKNLELYSVARQKQKHQQNQDQKQNQNQDKDKKNEKGNSPSGGGNDDKKNQDKKDSDKDKDKDKDKSYEDPSKGQRQFKSQKLSPEAADRVMDQLSSRERELQSQLRRQKGIPQQQEKDW